MGPKRNAGLKKNKVKIVWGEKNFWIKKNFQSKKNFGLKRFGPKNF